MEKVIEHFRSGKLTMKATETYWWGSLVRNQVFTFSEDSGRLLQMKVWTYSWWTETLIKKETRDYNEHTQIVRSEITSYSWWDANLSKSEICIYCDAQTPHLVEKATQVYGWWSNQRIDEKYNCAGIYQRVIETWTRGNGKLLRREMYHLHLDRITKCEVVNFRE